MAGIIKASVSETCRLWLPGDPSDEVLAPAQQTARPTSAAFIMDVPADIAHTLHERILEVPNVSAYLSLSWSGRQHAFDINIGHVGASKHTALEVLFGKYAIDASKMIGVGDGINDLELFTAVGHRIAVANAHPKLIAQADEVVAAQEADGLAEVVRRFL